MKAKKQVQVPVAPGPGNELVEFSTATITKLNAPKIPGDGTIILTINEEYVSRVEADAERVMALPMDKVGYETRKLFRITSAKNVKIELRKEVEERLEAYTDFVKMVRDTAEPFIDRLKAVEDKIKPQEEQYLEQVRAEAAQRAKRRAERYANRVETLQGYGFKYDARVDGFQMNDLIIPVENVREFDDQEYSYVHDEAKALFDEAEERRATERRIRQQREQAEADEKARQIAELEQLRAALMEKVKAGEGVQFPVTFNPDLDEAPSMSLAWGPIKTDADTSPNLDLHDATTLSKTDLHDATLLPKTDLHDATLLGKTEFHESAGVQNPDKVCPPEQTPVLPDISAVRAANPESVSQSPTGPSSAQADQKSATEPPVDTTPLTPRGKWLRTVEKDKVLLIGFLEQQVRATTPRLYSQEVAEELDLFVENVTILAEQCIYRLHFIGENPLKTAE